MKALSIHPAFAKLIITGQKTVEARTWTTSYRGDILICSTAKKEEGTVPGHALGVVTLKDIVPFKREHLEAACMDDWSDIYGLYAWILENSRPIKPIPLKGKLSLWSYDGEIEYLPQPHSVKEDVALRRTYWDPITYHKK